MAIVDKLRGMAGHRLPVRRETHGRRRDLRRGRTIALELLETRQLLNASASISVAASTIGEKSTDATTFTISIVDPQSLPADFYAWVPFTFSGSSATLGCDFQFSGEQTACLSAASPSAEFAITPVEDAEFEGDEKITITLLEGGWLSGQQCVQGSVTPPAREVRQ